MDFPAGVLAQELKAHSHRSLPVEDIVGFKYQALNRKVLKSFERAPRRNVRGFDQLRLMDSDLRGFASLGRAGALAGFGLRLAVRGFLQRGRLDVRLALVPFYSRDFIRQRLYSLLLKLHDFQQSHHYKRAFLLWDRWDFGDRRHTPIKT